jgi:hypothetical protein
LTPLLTCPPSKSATIELVWAAQHVPYVARIKLRNHFDPCICPSGHQN